MYYMGERRDIGVSSVNIVGVGTDIVEVERVERLCREHGAAFLQRVFTDGERAYCDGKRPSCEHYAARFAAKEAVLKALDAGRDIGANWREIEITRSTTGQPHVVLHGAALSRAEEMGIEGWHLSISHSRKSAVAVTIAVRAGEADLRDI